MLTKNTKSWKDFEASLSIMNANIGIYHKGNQHAYRVVATELRKLLCDTSRGRNNSLIPRLFKNAKLHPLHGDKSNIDEHTVLYIPSRLQFNGKGSSKIEKLVNENKKPIDINEWLSQSLFNQNITIEVFIRSVSDKEGAHSDKNYNSTLKLSKSVVIADDTLCSKFIVGIGEYLLKTLSAPENYFVSNYINHYIAIISKYVINKYNKLGRGVLIINYNEMDFDFEKELNIPYNNPEETACYFKKYNKENEVYGFVNDYKPESEFLFLHIDSKKELWLFKKELDIQN